MSSKKECPLTLSAVEDCGAERWQFLICLSFRPSFEAGLGQGRLMTNLNRGLSETRDSEAQAGLLHGA